VTELQTPSAVAAFPARYFDAWNGREAGAASTLLADRFAWRDPSLPAPLSALEDAERFFELSWRSFPDLTFELLGEPLVDEAGGRVAQEWRMTGTHQGEGVPAGVLGTGRPIDVTGTDVFTLDETGRATEIRACYDAMGLAAQLGLVS
jgi:steroid delta-isomerase-like uncharacterized protein